MVIFVAVYNTTILLGEGEDISLREVTHPCELALVACAEGKMTQWESWQNKEL